MTNQSVSTAISPKSAWTIGTHDQQALTLNRRYSWQLQLVLIYCV